LGVYTHRQGSGLSYSVKGRVFWLHRPGFEFR